MKTKALYLFVFVLFFGCSHSQPKNTIKIDASSNAILSDQSEFVSKVPKYEFSNILEEQHLQLLENPLMHRFKKSREKLSSDPYRPIFHYVNPEGNLNDPNGLSYWKGNWHLFYQAYPPEDPRQHWGHAISTDLIHWKDLPYAIYPDPEYACFSGNVLIENDRALAMYHGKRLGNMVAVSDDPLLLNWTKLTGKPVVSLPEKKVPYGVGDPCIWKKGETYYSLSQGRKKEGPDGKPIRANYLFRSGDLENWEYMHTFVEGDRFTEEWDDGACPYFLPISDRYILPFFSHKTGGQYLLGDYDKINDKFIATSHGLFNFGGIFEPGAVLAPSATSDRDGSVIIIFNMAPAKPTAGWNQIMSIPRRLTLLSKDEIGIQPAGDIESLRYDHKNLEMITLPANKELILDEIRGNALEIIARIDPGDAPMIEFNVLRSPEKEEYTRIAFYKQKGLRNWDRYSGWEREEWIEAKSSFITLESAHSSILPDVLSRPAETGPFYFEPEGLLELRVFIDKSIVEVFANGRQCVAMRVYPGLKESLGVSLRSQGQESKLISLDAWQMKNIYGDIELSESLTKK